MPNRLSAFTTAPLHIEIVMMRLERGPTLAGAGGSTGWAFTGQEFEKRRAMGAHALGV